jgi:CubicO group peptidase (beta-lactamase class C family)
VKLDQDRLKYAAAVAEEAVQAGTQPCAVIAVANASETLWTHTVPGNDSIADDTIFLLASISKPITACAIMRLVEQGQLLLNRPVAAYLPEFGREGKEKITTYHLLTHTSGLDESRWLEARLSSGQDTTGPCFEEACRTTLSFEPGSSIQYNSLSFAVLGALITRLTGQPYPDYMCEQMFAPLGMNDTAFSPADRNRAAPVHNFGDAAQLAAFMARAVPGGGLWSTAADLIAFGQTFLNGGRRGGYHLLSPAAIAAMTHLQVAGEVQWQEGVTMPFYYALGWGKNAHAPGSLGSSNAYAHGGATGTLLCIDPDWNLIFVYLTNTWADASETARLALQAVYGALTLE